MELGLKGRTALVTGASRGIGRACVMALLAEGARVFAVARDEAALNKVASLAPGRVVTASADLSTDAGCDLAVRGCLETFGGVDVLVNCAGSAGMGNVLELTRERIDSALRLKFHGYLRMAQLVAPTMKRQGWGRIVNIAGSAGTSPTAENLPTSLANIAVHTATRALSDELAPWGILVNLVDPGLTLTDRARALVASRADREGRRTGRDRAGGLLPVLGGLQLPFRFSPLHGRWRAPSHAVNVVAHTATTSGIRRHRLLGAFVEVRACRRSVSWRARTSRARSRAAGCPSRRRPDRLSSERRNPPGRYRA